MTDIFLMVFIIGQLVTSINYGGLLERILIQKRIYMMDSGWLYLVCKEDTVIFITMCWVNPRIANEMDSSVTREVF